MVSVDMHLGSNPARVTAHIGSGRGWVTVFGEGADCLALHGTCVHLRQVAEAILAQVSEAVDE